MQVSLQTLKKKKGNSLSTKVNVLEQGASESMSLVRDNRLATVYKVSHWLASMAYIYFLLNHIQ